MQEKESIAIPESGEVLAWLAKSPQHLPSQLEGIKSLVSSIMAVGLCEGVNSIIDSSSLLQFEFAQEEREKVFGPNKQLVVKLLKVACIRWVFTESQPTELCG